MLFPLGSVTFNQVSGGVTSNAVGDACGSVVFEDFLETKK